MRLSKRPDSYAYATLYRAGSDGADIKNFDEEQKAGLTYPSLVISDSLQLGATLQRSLSHNEDAISNASPANPRSSKSL